MGDLLNLPDEALLVVLRFLHYKDINSVSLVNKRLHRLCLDDSLWKWQCQHYFLDSRLREDERCNDHFISLFREYGRYSHYKEIRQAWWKIETFLEQHCPTVLNSLLGGVTEAELDAAEAKIGTAIPEDLRMSLRIHNGQDAPVRVPGVMGGYMVYTHVKADTLLPLSKIEKLYMYSCRGFMSGCAFVSKDSFSGLPSQFMAFTDVGGFTPGTIYAAVFNENGFSDDNFVTAPSYLEWLCSYADNLEQNAFHVEEELILKFYHEPGCADGDFGIVVKPTTCFVPEMSRIQPPNYFFAYRIRLEMPENTPSDSSCQLTTRYWHITDANGKQDEVRGPGVVGEYPVMKPGAKYAWISCTTFETPSGDMTGSFQFKNLRTGVEVDVPCPVFHMQAPFCSTAAERKRILKARTLENSGKNINKSATSEQRAEDYG